MRVASDRELLLAGEGVEICGEAGSIVYYHPFLVHGASDNRSRRARRVLHTHYEPVTTDGEAPSMPEPFWATLSEAQRRLVTDGFV